MNKTHRPEVIRLNDKFSKFQEHWTPKNLTSCNGQLVKIAKVQGEFIWHKHDNEDELFMVIRGSLTIDIKEGASLILKEGDLTVIPKGMEHRPHADSECWILMVEPPETLNTGEHRNELSVDDIEWI